MVSNTVFTETERHAIRPSSVVWRVNDVRAVSPDVMEGSTAWMNRTNQAATLLLVQFAFK